MAEIEPYWDDENRLKGDTLDGRFLPAWLDEDDPLRDQDKRCKDVPTLGELVDAIVRGASIAHAEVPDLRVLIEAVQSHPDARLIKRDDEGRFLGVFNPNDEKLDEDITNCTTLVISGGEVLVCACQHLSIGIELGARTRFGGDAGFWSAEFGGDASFRSAEFGGDAFFRSAEFGGGASFRSAEFDKDAEYLGAQFKSGVNFTSATIGRRLVFAEPPGEHDAVFRKSARLRVNKLIVRAGAAVELSAQQLSLMEGTRDLFARWDNSQSWVIQALRLVALFAWPRLLKPMEAFGLGRRGRLIKGEDSDDPEELAIAAADYNRLRDLFRSQPSTDEQEDICNFKYLDLGRRATLADPKTPWHQRVWLTVWDWGIKRKALGYLIYPSRVFVSGLAVIVLFTLIYVCWAGEATIHNYTSPGTFPAGGWSRLGTSLYYSVVTFTSLGYGDIQPLGWFRLVAAAEALLGVALMALFVVSWGRKMIR